MTTTHVQQTVENPDLRAILSHYLDVTRWAERETYPDGAEQTVIRRRRLAEQLLGNTNPSPVKPCNFSDDDVVGAEATSDYCYAHQAFCS